MNKPTDIMMKIIRNANNAVEFIFFREKITDIVSLSGGIHPSNHSIALYYYYLYFRI